VSFQPNLYLSILSSGTTCGMIVHIDWSFTEILCYMDRRPLLNTYQYLKIGIQSFARLIPQQLKVDFQSVCGNLKKVFFNLFS
jgi:hypothetical protein